jgi:excinuclease ABC subunit C
MSTRRKRNVKRSPGHAIRGSGAADLARAIRTEAPAEPGVYLFHGERGEVLYVGKAVNLRRRLLDHLRPSPREEHPRHARLVHAICGFAYETAASELLALLREDDLIKQHRPRFNVRQNEFAQVAWLELTRDRHPRLRVTAEPAGPDEERVFGPYQDRFMADRLRVLAQDHLGLRSCAAPEVNGLCLEFDLGRCVGPCRPAVPATAYDAAVARVVAFLRGDDSEVAARLHHEMTLASSSLGFEVAQRLKDRIEFCRRFCERQRFLSAFRERRLVVIEQGPPGLTYEFAGGRLVSVLGSCVDVRAQDPRFVLDRAGLVHGWLKKNARRVHHHFVPPP